MVSIIVFVSAGITFAEQITKYKENQLDLLFNGLVESFSTRWNKAPDVPVIIDVAKKARIGVHVVGDDVYCDGKLIGHYESNNVFIPKISKKVCEKGSVDYSGRIRREMEKLIKAKGEKKQIEEFDINQQN